MARNDHGRSFEVSHPMDSKKKSVVSASMLLVGTGIGTGVLVLPKGMAAVGLWPMLALLAFGSVLSAFTTWVLFMAVATYTERTAKEALHGSMENNGSSNRADGPSYACLLGEVAPQWMLYLLDSVLVVYAEGTVVTYFLFLSEFLCKLSFWPAALDAHSTVVVIACVVFPALLFPTVGGLSRLSSMPLIALSFMVLGIWSQMPQAVQTRNTPLEEVGDLSTAPSVMCMCVYAFMWHTNCVGVARELQNPTPSRCAAVSLGGGSLLFVLYAFIAFGGYISWGDALLNSSSIVDMYGIDEPMFICVRIALSAALLVAIPLNLYPLRESGAGLLKNCIPGYELNAWRRVLWGVALVTITAITAIVYPDVVRIIVLLGGTLAALVMLIFPALIAKLVFPQRVWLLVMCVTTIISLILVAAAIGLLGTPVS